MTSLQNNVDVIQDSLDDIKDAIINKGGTISGDITSYAEDILNIRSIGLNREISSQGVFQMPTANFTFILPENAIDVGDGVMFGAFYNCTSLTSADLSSLTTVSGYDALRSAFYDCTSLTSADLSSLMTISGSTALYLTFRGCTSLISVNLSSLAIISGDKALYSAFGRCTSLMSLSFPSLTSASFGSYTNQFKSMLHGVTGCTVHFPSNLQSVIGDWSDVVSGFSGTNTTVLFDLPSTGGYAAIGS